MLSVNELRRLTQGLITSDKTNYKKQKNRSNYGIFKPQLTKDITNKKKKKWREACEEETVT